MKHPLGRTHFSRFSAVRSWNRAVNECDVDHRMPESNRPPLSQDLRPSRKAAGENVGVKPAVTARRIDVFRITLIFAAPIHNPNQGAFQISYKEKTSHKITLTAFAR